MNGFSRFSLILLRLAIGWHFLFEGIEKVESIERGPSELSRPFTSEPYLREAAGPLGDFMRTQIGDPDQKALALLSLGALPQNQDPSRVPPRTRISPELEAEWDAYFERFAAHYNLNSQTDRALYERARGALDQAKEKAGEWLAAGSKEVERSFPTASVQLKQSTQERIAEYRHKLDEIALMVHQELPTFDKDVAKQRLKTAKADAARLRTELVTELNGILYGTLEGILTPEQKKAGPVPDATAPDWRGWSRLQWVDAITSWGLIVVGLGLLLGLFTRTCCCAGAAFLLMLYLTASPFPWLPEPSRVEGHYYFVNKNLVEMLALLALGTLPTGCWLGLDGLVRFLYPWNWKTKTVSQAY
jgi:uncharacterized membrane protein YphA (DoxX/SURF4 family)